MNAIGCDVSSWQKGLTMAAVKEAGFAFAILRGGYTGTGAARTKNEDVCFEEFYRQAKEIGLPVGAYWYSCARTREEGEAEAQFLYEECLQGKVFEYPVYIDVECDKWQGNNKSGATDAVIGFCSYLEQRGFFTGVYASASWLRDKLDLAKLKNYSRWVAAWTKDPPAIDGYDYDMWQNSATGNIGRYAVDTNICYKEFPKIIKAAGLNGYADPVQDPEARITELKAEIERQDKAIAQAAALLQQALALLEG